MNAVTVVIPTFNRPGKLKQTLEALESQNFKQFSVIVSDDGSSSENLARNNALLHSCSFPVQLITGTNAGASHATNRGINAADEGLIILFDDDILPAPDAIAMHVQFHTNHPGCVVAGSAATSTTAADTDVQRYKVFMENEWKKKRPESLHLLKVTFDSFITTTANTSFTKATYSRIGSFDETLRDGYDVDFSMRALVKNVDVYFDPSISSVHNDSITLQYYAKRQKAYDESKQRIAEKYPELATVLLRNSSQRPGIMKRIFYSMASSKLLVSLAESGKLSWFLPQVIRYRIYGNIIAALSQP